MRLTLFPSWSKLAASHPGDQKLTMRGQVTLCFECWVQLEWPEGGLNVLLQPGPGCNLQDWDSGHFQGLVSWRSQGQRDGSVNASPTSTLLLWKKRIQASQRPSGSANGSSEDGKLLKCPSLDRPLFLLSDFLFPSAPRAWMSQKGWAPSWQELILLAGSFSEC